MARTFLGPLGRGCGDPPGEEMCVLLCTLSWLLRVLGRPELYWEPRKMCLLAGELNLLVLRHHGFGVILPFLYRFIWWIYPPNL